MFARTAGVFSGKKACFPEGESGVLSVLDEYYPVPDPDQRV